MRQLLRCDDALPPSKEEQIVVLTGENAEMQERVAVWDSRRAGALPTPPSTLDGAAEEEKINAERES